MITRFRIAPDLSMVDARLDDRLGVGGAMPGHARRFKHKTAKSTTTISPPVGFKARRGKKPFVIMHRSDLEQFILHRMKAELPKLLQEAQPSPDPFGAARARGDTYKRMELAKSENLTLLEAARRIEKSEKWLNTLRQRGEYYALVDDGRARGFRYPSWQFDASKPRRLAVLAALAKAGVDCWGVHAFMQLPSMALAGKAPRDVMLDAKAPLDDVLTLIARRYAEEQGAS